MIQLIPHYHIGQKGTAFQCLRGGDGLPPHMQILLPDGGQGFVHLPVIAHGHLGTGVLHGGVELFAEVRRDSVVRVHKGQPLAPGRVQPGVACPAQAPVFLVHHPDAAVFGRRRVAQGRAVVRGAVVY